MRAKLASPSRLGTQPRSFSNDRERASSRCSKGTSRCRLVAQGQRKKTPQASHVIVESMELPEPIDLTAKLYRLKDCPDKLDADDQQFVNAMVDRLERGERPYRIQLLRIKDMQVPGEAPLVDPIWREGTVTALRKDLDQVIWRYMPLEQLFFLLSTGTLHFSPLCCMKDSSEGQLPKRAFEQTKAMLPPHFSQPGAAIDADTMTNLSIAYRQRDACISCWYMGTTQTTLPCGTNMRQELALRFEPLLAGCIRLLTDVMTQISIWLGSHTTNPMKRNDTSTTPTLDHSS